MFKNIIQYIGITILILFSFFYTEKTVSTIKQHDPVMIQLLEEKSKYSIETVNAVITDNYITPGLIGCEVDIDKSYSSLKRLGSFNSTLLEYKSVTPKISSQKEYNKYITNGNKSKNTITLIFKIKETTDIDNIVNILNNKNVKATFFIDGKYLETNTNKVQELIKMKHEVLNYGYNNKYDKDLLIWSNNIIERLNYNNPKFCYLEEENEKVLNLCSSNEMKTIIPNLIISKNPLLEVKENINKGSLISFNVNSTTENELNLIINYITQKGYKIDILSNHLEETMINTCKKNNLSD